MTSRPASPAAGRRPNVVFVIMDDLAWGDLACHGNPYVRTPHLDRLHAQSTRLTRYCSGPLCTPARAALMTGRYPYRTRAVDTYCGRSMIDPDEVTLAEILRAVGYRTGIFGKWHLGDCYPMRAMDKGFEEALVHNGGGLRQWGNFGRDGYFDPDLMHNGQLEPFKGYCTDIFTDAAMKFIAQHRAQPFFVYLATNAPHTPLEIADEYVQPYLQKGLPETFAQIYGMVENIDLNVGKVLAQLDALNLADDTIVIYTSDHGPCSWARHNGQDRFRNAGSARGQGRYVRGKFPRPCFIRWPGRLPSGRDIDRISNPIDWLPTLANACGAKVPTDRAIDGVDLLPLLCEQVASDNWPERHIFFQWHRGDVPQRYRNFAIIGQRYKLCRPEHFPDQSRKDELYDLVADPYEKRAIISKHPELAARLSRDDRWFDDVSATRRAHTYDPPRIHLGTGRENPTVLTRQDWRVIGPEGWNDEHLGYWVVHVAHTAAYRVAIRFAPCAKPTKLHLRCGLAEASCDLTVGQSEHCFEVVRLQAGDADLHAWLEVAGVHRGVRFVEIKKL